MTVVCVAGARRDPVVPRASRPGERGRRVLPVRHRPPAAALLPVPLRTPLPRRLPAHRDAALPGYVQPGLLYRLALASLNILVQIFGFFFVGDYTLLPFPTYMLLCYNILLVKRQILKSFNYCILTEVHN